MSARRWVCGFAIIAAVAVAPAGASGARAHLTLELARKAARAAVLEHPSYRVIVSPQSLRTRRCWHAPAGAVRCSLYRLAPNPCALDGHENVLCVQAIARRDWLVQVNPRGPNGTPVARILRIRSALSAPRD